MLEPPAVQDEAIASRLESEYGLSVAELSFLPLGADADSAAYRVVARDAKPYFLKLRRGPFAEAVATVPRWLAASGMRRLIPPLPTRTTGAPWTRLAPFTLVLYPFVAGRSGWEIALTEQQWIALGETLRALHAAKPPPALTDGIPQETYAAHCRARVDAFLGRAADHSRDDPEARQLRALLVAHGDTIRHILARAKALAALLSRRPPARCLCHGDIHAGNVLIDEAGELYLVDWDTLVLAPKERDLMFVGGGVGGTWNHAWEAAWFYRGYDRNEADPTALAYFRYERIVRDIAEFCEQLLDTNEGGGDRAVMLRHFASQFEPGNVVDIARATDHSDPRERPREAS